MRARREYLDCAQPADVAARAAFDIDTGDTPPEGLHGLDCGLFGDGGGAKRGSGASEQRALIAVGEQSVMPDAVEAARQNVQAEATQELDALELQDPAPLAVSVVLVAKAHFVRVECDEPLVRDRGAVGIAPEVLEHLLGAGEGALA